MRSWCDSKVKVTYFFAFWKTHFISSYSYFMDGLDKCTVRDIVPHRQKLAEEALVADCNSRLQCRMRSNECICSNHGTSLRRFAAPGGHYRGLIRSNCRCQNERR